MKAADMEEDRATFAKMPTSREWLRVVGAVVAIALICALWTVWA